MWIVVLCMLCLGTNINNNNNNKPVHHHYWVEDPLSRDWTRSLAESWQHHWSRLAHGEWPQGTYIDSCPRLLGACQKMYLYNNSKQQVKHLKVEAILFIIFCNIDFINISRWIVNTSFNFFNIPTVDVDKYGKRISVCELNVVFYRGTKRTYSLSWHLKHVV